MIYLYIIVQEFTKFKKQFLIKIPLHKHIYIKLNEISSIPCLLYYFAFHVYYYKIYRIYLCSIFIDRRKSYLDRKAHGNNCILVSLWYFLGSICPLKDTETCLRRQYGRITRKGRGKEEWKVENGISARIKGISPWHRCQIKDSKSYIEGEISSSQNIQEDAGQQKLFSLARCIHHL